MDDVSTETLPYQLVLCGEANMTPSSSLEGGPIIGLYSGAIFSWFLKLYPLLIDPHIKEMA